MLNPKPKLILFNQIKFLRYKLHFEMSQRSYFKIKQIMLNLDVHVESSLCDLVN